MELIITLVKGNQKKFINYLVPDEVVHVCLHVKQKFQNDGWFVESADEKNYFLATKK